VPGSSDTTTEFEKNEDFPVGKRSLAISCGPESTTGSGEIRGMATESPGPEVFQPRLTRPHPLIQNTRRPPEALDPYGRPSRHDLKRLDVQASKAMFKLALVVMDRFIKALEAQGLKVDVTEDHQGHGAFAYDGRDRVQTHIRERTKRAEHVPTDKERARKNATHGPVYRSGMTCTPANWNFRPAAE
jgi:hypothetical protein